jgi:hypothetical protein
MTFDGMPGYDLINVVKDLDPMQALRDQDASERMKAYPGLVGAGKEDFGCAEQSDGVWRILSLGCMDPHGARLDLAAHLRKAAERRQDPAVRAEMLAAAGRLDPEEGEPATANEWVVAERRYRVVRVQGFLRLGEDGPEPPRTTDTEPVGDSPPAWGAVLDPTAPTSPSEAMQRLELLSLVPAPGSVSDHARQEAIDAMESHPGVVLLPTDYVVAEENDGHWLPLGGGHGPKDARRSLGFYLREIAPRFVPPGIRPPTPDELAEYVRVADRLGTETGDEFTVCGRRFRTIRIVRLIRVGPDGPEMARPSDEESP